MNQRAIGPLLAVLLLIVGGGAEAAQAAAVAHPDPVMAGRSGAMAGRPPPAVALVTVAERCRGMRWA